MLNECSAIFLVLAVMYAAMVLAGEYFFPQRSGEAESYSLFVFVRQVTSMAGFCSEHTSSWTRVFGGYFLLTILSMVSITLSVFGIVKHYYPEISMDVFWVQMKMVSVNFLILPFYQVLSEVLVISGYSKASSYRMEPLTIIMDVCLWILVFEISWYAQHRYCHENKFLWTYGHSAHHQWNKPELMIGVTNFSFDHIFEAWVTMSSSFAPFMIFPINWHVGKAISLIYMIIAILAHFDSCRNLSSYHLNHHYTVTKNFGSHVPIFDIIFGTYEWNSDAPRKKLVE